MSFRAKVARRPKRQPRFHQPHDRHGRENPSPPIGLGGSVDLRDILGGARGPTAGLDLPLQDRRAEELPPTLIRRKVHRHRPHDAAIFRQNIEQARMVEAEPAQPALFVGLQGAVAHPQGAPAKPGSTRTSKGTATIPAPGLLRRVRDVEGNTADMSTWTVGTNRTPSADQSPQARSELVLTRIVRPLPTCRRATSGTSSAKRAAPRHPRQRSGPTVFSTAHCAGLPADPRRILPRSDASRRWGPAPDGVPRAGSRRAARAACPAMPRRSLPAAAPGRQKTPPRRPAAEMPRPPQAAPSAKLPVAAPPPRPRCLPGHAGLQPHPAPAPPWAGTGNPRPHPRPSGQGLVQEEGSLQEDIASGCGSNK